jgi:hypothetical protein
MRAESSSTRLALLAALLAAQVAVAAGELPTYPGAVHTRIGGDLVLGGRLHKLAWFTTDDPLEHVAAWFARHWEAQGYPTSVDGEPGHQELTVSALHTRQGLLHAVVLRRHQGRTVGFPVVRDLWLKVAPPKRTGLLALEGALFSQELWFEEPGRPAQHRAQVVPGALDPVHQAVRERLGDQGFTVLQPSAHRSEGRRQVIFEAARDAERVLTVITQAQDATVVVAQTWWGRAGGGSGR